MTSFYIKKKKEKRDNGGIHILVSYSSTYFFFKVWKNQLHKASKIIKLYTLLTLAVLLED